MGSTTRRALEIGTVRAPSGKVIILDPGYLNLWCHDRPPTMPDGVLSSDEATEEANRSVDCEIVGPDAERAGALLGRQSHPLFVFDMPPRGLSALQEKFRALVSESHLDASLRVLPERVTHLDRVDIALKRGRQAGEMQFHGLWCCVFDGVPVGQAIPVLAEPMPPGPDQGRWRRVTLQCRKGAPTASERVGSVMVDFARLMFADVVALGRWVHEEPMDGLADFAFWGRDAAVVASEMDAPSLEDGVFGWRNQPVLEVVSLGMAVEQKRDERRLLFATDFRPHSHNYVLMERLRNSECESGCVDLGEASVCGFATSWGDAIFEVYRDVDADGRLLAVRAELGTPEIVDRMRALEAQWNAGSPGSEAP